MLYFFKISLYLANGGDKHTAINNHKQNYTFGDLDTDVFQDYVNERTPIVQFVEDRIKIITTDDNTDSDIDDIDTDEAIIDETCASSESENIKDTEAHSVSIQFTPLIFIINLIISFTKILF